MLPPICVSYRLTLLVLRALRSLLTMLSVAALSLMPVLTPSRIIRALGLSVFAIPQKKLQVPTKNSGVLQWKISSLGSALALLRLLTLRTFGTPGMKLRMLLRGCVSCTNSLMTDKMTVTRMLGRTLMNIIVSA